MQPLGPAGHQTEVKKHPERPTSFSLELVPAGPGGTLASHRGGLSMSPGSCQQRPGVTMASFQGGTPHDPKVTLKPSWCEPWDHPPQDAGVNLRTLLAWPQDHPTLPQAQCSGQPWDCFVAMPKTSPGPHRDNAGVTPRVMPRPASAQCRGQPWRHCQRDPGVMLTLPERHAKVNPKMHPGPCQHDPRIVSTPPSVMRSTLRSLPRTLPE